MIEALLVITSLAVFINVIAILTGILLIVLLHRDVRDVLMLTKLNTGRLMAIEKVTMILHQLATQEMVRNASTPPQPQGLQLPIGVGKMGDKFVTEDGAHEADSFEELLHKIAQDPRYHTVKPEDVHGLRQMFEDQMEHDNDTDNDNEGEEWKGEEHESE